MNKKLIISIILVLLWLGFIFYNSNLSANISTKESKIVINKIEYV